MNRKLEACAALLLQGCCFLLVALQFEHHPPNPIAAECELGTLFPGETASVRVRLRLTAVGTFVDDAIKDAANYGQQERSAIIRTRASTTRCRS